MQELGEKAIDLPIAPPLSREMQINNLSRMFKYLAPIVTVATITNVTGQEFGIPFMNWAEYVNYPCLGILSVTFIRDLLTP